MDIDQSTVAAQVTVRQDEGGSGVTAQEARRPSRPSVNTAMSSGLTSDAQETHSETVAGHDSGADQMAPQPLFHNYLRAFYPFNPTVNLPGSEDSSLMTASIKPGDVILVHSIHANGWADGTVLSTGERGWLPTNYCEPYDHPYLRNLLNAMTQFWDILGANEESNLSTFVRQDYIRGLIAGVRYMLEHADCLHRDAGVVQGHTGVRRMRKSLLADLSTLVQIAKRLQETISEPFAGEVIHVLLDDLITKAFKVVIRAVGFMDIWTQETSDVRGEPSTTVAASNQVRPAADANDALAIDPRTSIDDKYERPVDSAKVIPSEFPRDVGGHAPAGAQVETDLSAARIRPLSSAFRSRKGSVAHRLSLVVADHASSGTLASEQLSKMHDLCISHIGAFIGHHLHSRPSTELVATTERLVESCKNILSIVDEVYCHDTKGSSSAQQARAQFQDKLEELVRSTKDVFRFSDQDDGETVMLPEQHTHLVNVGTSLIRTAGECVAKTRSIIEQIGDFELERPVESLHESLVGSPIVGESAPNSKRASTPKAAEAEAVREQRLSVQMLPPPPPIRTRAVTLTTETIDFALTSPTSDTSSPKTPFSPASHKSLPPAPMQRRAAVRTSQSVSKSGENARSTRPVRPSSISPARQDSVGISIAGSTDTVNSSGRDSAFTTVSEVSTRATTPEHAKESNSPDPDLLNSFASLSSLQSAATDDDTEDETQLLQRTYANELTLNKDGHVTGGSLPALAEQLTTHDSAPDPSFVSAFFLTFRMFTTPRELAQALIARFEYVDDSRTMGTPVRLRIYNVFKGWLEIYWNPDADRDALGDIRYFALHKLKHHLPSAGERLAELTRKVTAGYHTGTISGPLVSGVGKTSTSIASQHGVNASTPEPIITKSQLNALRASAAGGGSPCNLLDFDPLELARQFTLVASKVFCDIQPDELLGLEWNKKGSQRGRNVRNMCGLNTDLANVVGDTILAPEDAKKRAHVIKHWVKIAMHCLELNNYESLMAIMCSLNSSVVQRLKRTWELTSKKTKARLDELNAVIDFSRNQMSLRRRLEVAAAPCLPFLGIFLTDLTFVDAGNPATRELPGRATATGEPATVINFDKYMRTARIISQLQRFQLPYRLQPVPELQAWMGAHLQRMRARSDEMLGSFHRRSLVIEPKLDEGKAAGRSADASRSNSITTEERPKTSAAAAAAAGGGAPPEPAVREKFGAFLKQNAFGFKIGSHDLPGTAEASEAPR